jgi:hypothetical protein
MKPLRSDPQEIARTLNVLFVDGDVVELRVPKTQNDGVLSGYFTDHAALARAAAARNGDQGVYVTLNPVVPSLLARAANRVRSRARVTTADKDIQQRRWLLVDCDPVRPSEISSSNAEHEAALERACDIRSVLSEEGWPAPVLADSGNGAHLLYRVDLPNDEPSTLLLAAVLKALAARFNDAAVKVDEAVFNAARISKVYGTMARKGDDVPERPHRLSRILETPPTLELVSRDLLQALLPPEAPPSKPRPAPSRSRFNIEAFSRSIFGPARRSITRADASGFWRSARSTPITTRRTPPCSSGLMAPWASNASTTVAAGRHGKMCERALKRHARAGTRLKSTPALSRRRSIRSTC